MGSSTRLAIALTCISAGSALASELVPVGPEIEVASAFAEKPSAAFDVTGTTVIGYHRPVEYDYTARSYSAEGAVPGPVRLVWDGSNQERVSPWGRLAARPAGGLRTVFGLGFSGLRLAGLDSTAFPTAPSLAFDDGPVISSSAVELAVAVDGTTLAVWAGGTLAPETSSEVWARFLDEDGTPSTEAFRVSSVLDALDPAAAFAPSGAAIVLWSDDEIRGRIFGSVARADSAFQVNLHDPGRQVGPDLAVSGSGAFAVVWTSESSPGDDVDGMSVQGAVFDASGARLGEHQINAFTPGDQGGDAGHARVVALPDSSFLAVWPSDGAPGAEGARGIFGSAILARQLGATGVPLGTSDLRIDAPSEAAVGWPTIASRPDGRIFVAWEHVDGLPTIRGRWFRIRGTTPIFGDSFEGDLDGWDVVVPGR